MSLSTLTIATLLVSCVSGLPILAKPGEGQLAISVVEGDGAINSIRHRRAREPVVRVTDSQGTPLRGATVTFVLPASGPSGFFGDSGLSVTLHTDERGLAQGRGLRPNQIPGQFRIRVTAILQGIEGTATVTQTNAGPARH
jgi:hypothetical protein